MNDRPLRLSTGIDVVHPAVLQRRIHDVLLTALTGLVAAALALAIIVKTPNASISNGVLVLAAIVAGLAIAWFVVSSRLEVTVALLGIYLLVLYGPIKLGLGGGPLAHAADDVLILAICIGALMRLAVRRERVALPALSGWVFAFVATVALEAFNPATGGFLKVLGGFRQELHFVPFFFFGYLLLRSKRRLRQAFVLVGVCALANGAVAAYQSGLSPQQIARWGPGYRELYQPTSLGQKGANARVFDYEGEAHPRPIGLGSDSGFSGGVGLTALPLCLALLATWRSRRRWFPALLALGALAGVATGGGRLQVVGAVLSVAAFLGLAAIGRAGLRRPLAALLAVAVLAVPVGAVFVAFVHKSAFGRYGTFEKASLTTIATHKSGGYTKIPGFIAKTPFGIGLGTTGPVGGFGGTTLEQGEGAGASAETQYNFLVDELGAPGLIVWVALSLYIVVLVVRRLPAVRDGDLSILLAGAFAPFVALIFIGFSGPTLTSTILGPLFWFTIGVAAYWLAGPGRRLSSESAVLR